MSRPDAVLTVYDTEQFDVVAKVPLYARVIQMSELGQEEEENLIAIALESEDSDLEIPAEWVGHRISVEVAPSAVQGIHHEEEVDRVAVLWGAEVA